MIRKLAHWIAGLTIAMLMMAVVLAGAAHAQGTADEWRGAPVRIEETISPAVLAATGWSNAPRTEQALAGSL